jgi:hypothetical protein
MRDIMQTAALFCAFAAGMAIVGSAGAYLLSLIS